MIIDLRRDAIRLELGDKVISPAGLPGIVLGKGINIYCADCLLQSSGCERVSCNGNYVKEVKE